MSEGGVTLVMGAGLDEQRTDMSDERIPDGIIVQGGSLDGRTLPLHGDPLDPPQVLKHDVGDGRREVYSPRPRGDADDGPLWVYAYVWTEPAPTL